jgi:uncharacterized protein YfaS (alpha-2-macroglobulin family)
MKTTLSGRALLAASVCFAAPLTIPSVFAQAPKPAPKAKPVPAAPQGPPGAEIKTPQTVLGGGEEVEITFSAPMIADTAIGKAVPAASVLDIQPVLEADLVWRSTRSASIKIKSVVALGVNYRFALRRDVKDAAGKPVVPAVTAAGPAFLITEHQPRWFNTSGADARRPVIFLYANDAVNPDTVAKGAFFRDKQGRTVTASCTGALVSELGRYPQEFGAWGRRFNANSPTLPAPESLTLSVVKVTPSSLLPPGESWVLVVPKALPNAVGAARTAADYVIQYGTIPTMELAGVEAEPVLDGPRRLHVSFSKSAADLKPEEWPRYLAVEPKPVGLKFEGSGRTVTLTGNFEHQTAYKVKVQAGTPALDGTTLSGLVEKTVQFAAHEPHLSLPSFDAAQWLGGRGEFSFATANLQEAKVQLKKVPLERAVDALRAYEVYQNDPSKQDSEEFTRIPFAAMAGRKVWEKTWKSGVELDHSERFGFTWDEVNGGKRAPGMYFVSVEGDAKEEVESRERLGGQSLVQLTDIGLAWKWGGQEGMIFAFSHSTGQPLSGVSLQTWTDDGDAVEQQTTGPDGTAKLKLENTKWLLAQKDGDMHGVSWHSGMEKLDMWSFDLPYTGRAPDKAWRELLMFTERPVYQPGETVFFKAISRMQNTSGLEMPPAGEAAKVRLLDPQHRLVVERDIKFSDIGTFADAMRLPAQGLGWFTLKVSFPLPKGGAKKPGDDEYEGEEDGEEEEGAPREVHFEQPVLVQEYQPNSFRIDFNSAAAAREGDLVKVPLHAAYLMGKALSDAEAKWTARLAMTAFAPEKWDGFRFGHARSYYVWDGQEYHHLPEDDWASPLLTGQDTVKLNERGDAIIEAPAPVSFGVPGPRTLSVEAEVTDINQQTIAASWARTEHTSEFYLGAKRPANAVRAGEELSMELAAVKTSGTRWEQPVQVSALVEHLTWNAVRVETAGGGSSVRNDLVFAKVTEQTLTLNPAGGAFVFKPGAAGTHNITFTAKDTKGADVRTVVSVDVFGADAMTWQQQDGVKLELVCDKDSYKAGETAKVVVKSPLNGTALVTVEQSRVLWQKLLPLAPGGVVEIPVQEDWSPNVFVSVTHIRGGKDDPREQKMPEYRVGFAQLRVESHRHELALDIKPVKPEFRPGETVEVVIHSKDSAGKAVPNTEMAFWAVDEGILSLMPWEAPDALAHFHQDRSLFVTTGLSLESLMKENSKELEFTNKGFVIGGGGEGEAVNIGMRKNFKPTAYWHGTLKTGEDGSVKVSFPAPDNLTEFRLVAVANEGVSRFGTAESKLKINKPLMLEPALPRFANTGDEITLKAVVHNTTEKAAEVKVTLAHDERVSLPAGTETRTLSLAPQGTKAALFTVKFVADGPTELTWTADGGSKEMSDSVLSKLNVGIPEPLLREVKFMTLTTAEDGKSLLDGVRPEVFEGAGEVTITLSNSRVLEGAEAVEKLLTYPYGCVEQTMSSMMPWLALRDLKKALPSINKPDEEIANAIQKGVDRLLSMQTNAGGLAYWPGGEEPLAWASAHGALGLILSSRVGAQVPEARLKQLLDWLSGSLREAGDEENEWALGERAYAAWVLALAGRAEPAYHEALYKKAEQLGEFGRAMLALAIAEANGPADMAKAALSAPNAKNQWWNRESATAVRAMALMKLKDPAADAEMGRLMASRSARGDWRNTFNNAWTLLALSREAAVAPPLQAGQPCVLTLGGKSQSIALPGEPASQTITMTRDGKTPPQFTSKVAAGAKYFARIEVTGRAPGGPQPARNAGFGVSRTWQRMAPDGTLSPADQLRTGDLVLVSLDVDVSESAQYLVIDDPLPATLEGVNTNFDSMVTASNEAALEMWACDHTEMRRDRVLFFRDFAEEAGKFHLQYLARVVASGNVMAPPTRIEMMYDPARFGHSASGRLTTKSSPDEEVAVK